MFSTRLFSVSEGSTFAGLLKMVIDTRASAAAGPVSFGTTMLCRRSVARPEPVTLGSGTLPNVALFDPMSMQNVLFGVPAAPNASVTNSVIVTPLIVLVRFVPVVTANALGGPVMPIVVIHRWYRRRRTALFAVFSLGAS